MKAVTVLKEMLTNHVKLTDSKKGQEILNDFSNYLQKFKKVLPHDFDKMYKATVRMEEKGLSGDEALIEAFYAFYSNK